MNPEKTALIEERIKRERPNRTLFVRNLGVNEPGMNMLNIELTGSAGDS